MIDPLPLTDLCCVHKIALLEKEIRAIGLPALLPIIVSRSPPLLFLALADGELLHATDSSSSQPLTEIGQGGSPEQFADVRENHPVHVVVTGTADQQPTAGVLLLSPQQPQMHVDEDDDHTDDDDDQRPSEAYNAISEEILSIAQEVRSMSVFYIHF